MMSDFIDYLRDLPDQIDTDESLNKEFFVGVFENLETAFSYGNNSGSPRPEVLQPMDYHEAGFDILYTIAEQRPEYAEYIENIINTTLEDSIKSGNLDREFIDRYVELSRLNSTLVLGNSLRKQEYGDPELAEMVEKMTRGRWYDQLEVVEGSPTSGAVSYYLDHPESYQVIEDMLYIGLNSGNDRVSSVASDKLKSLEIFKGKFDEREEKLDAVEENDNPSIGAPTASPLVP